MITFSILQSKTFLRTFSTLLVFPTFIQVSHRPFPDTSSPIAQLAREAGAGPGDKKLEIRIFGKVTPKYLT